MLHFGHARLTARQRRLREALSLPKPLGKLLIPLRDSRTDTTTLPGPARPEGVSNQLAHAKRPKVDEKSRSAFRFAVDA